MRLPIGSTSVLLRQICRTGYTQTRQAPRRSSLVALGSHRLLRTHLRRVASLMYPSQGGRRLTGSAIGRRWAAVCRPPPHPGVMGTAPSAELLARWNKREAARCRVHPARDERHHRATTINATALRIAAYLMRPCSLAIAAVLSHVSLEVPWCLAWSRRAPFQPDRSTPFSPHRSPT